MLLLCLQFFACFTSMIPLIHNIDYAALNYYTYTDIQLYKYTQLLIDCIIIQYIIYTNQHNIQPNDYLLCDIVSDTQLCYWISLFTFVHIILLTHFLSSSLQHCIIYTTCTNLQLKSINNIMLLNTLSTKHF